MSIPLLQIRSEDAFYMQEVDVNFEFNHQFHKHQSNSRTVNSFSNRIDSQHPTITSVFMFQESAT